MYIAIGTLSNPEMILITGIDATLHEGVESLWIWVSEGHPGTSSQWVPIYLLHCPEGHVLLLASLPTRIQYPHDFFTCFA